MKTSHALEFDRILKQVAEYAVMDEAAGRITALGPIDDELELRRAHGHVRRMLRRIESGDALPSGRVPAVAEILDIVERDGAVLEAEALRDLHLFLSYAADVVAFFRSAADDGTSRDRPEPSDSRETRDDHGGTDETSANLVAHVTVPQELRRELQRVILPDGTVNEEAIPEIARLKREIQRLNSGLLDTAEQMIRRDRHMYQGDRPTVRDGRTVVPLAANFRGRIDGIVHESSGSGETVYVEPRALVDLNNGLVQAHNGIHREIRRVLRELSGRVRAAHDDLTTLWDAVVEADLLLTRARYGAHTGGTVVPIGERIVLHGARHPLLGAGCVPLDLSYAEDTRIVIISGPNTGGKTVLLKTVGLLSMMNQSAVPVPVQGDSMLPLFDYWGVDIGDEQSLDEALSTFSGHLRNLAEVCDHAGPHSLVLLDELGSGTDPEEGAALSMAVVDHLFERGSTVLVTTHQTVLKHYGYTRAGAANASMAFDEQTHQPTFRVVPGRPGASHALETAHRQGLNREVLRRAEGYLNDRQSSVAEIINRLGTLEDELREKTRRLDARWADGDRRDEVLAEREAAVNRREAELRREGLVELDRLIRESRSRVENEVRRLRERGAAVSRDDIRRAQDQLRSLEDAREEEHRHVEAAESASRAGADRRARRSKDSPRRRRSGDAVDGPVERTPAEGDEVRHRRTNRRGTVRSVRNGKAEVQFGAIRMTVPSDELEVTSGAGAGNGRPTITAPRHSAPAMLELDLRGRHLAEALSELERQVDAAVLSGIPRFSVIHGTGTGVLQKGVQDYLRARSEVASFSFAAPEEGGFGKTNVELT